MLTYYTFIRPKEILMLKKYMINLKNQIIKLPANITKSGKPRTITIPDELKKYLLKIDFNKINDNEYIFSDKFSPGKKRKDSRYIGKRWTRLREEIGLGKDLQFYSLKDTGIIDMLKSGISPEIVRDQAGHSSLEITNKYIKNYNLSANPEIKEKMNNF